MVRAIKTHTHTDAPAPKGKSRHKGDDPKERRAVKKTPVVVEKPAPKVKAKKGSRPLAPRDREVLAVLARLRPNAGGLTLPEIAAKAGGLNLTFLADRIGSHDPASRTARDATKGVSLTTRGLVAQTLRDGDDKAVRIVKITAAGRAALKAK